MTIGSLFSGIGGLERGLELLGLGPVLWQAECALPAFAVLASHWPEARRYDRVEEIDGRAKRPDLICGGFPCQDISDAGTNHQRRGLDGERSGLWREFARIVGELRPRWVFVENVPSLAERGLGRVLGSLSALGFDAEWGAFCGCWAGAPHARERLFVVARAHGQGESDRAIDGEVARLSKPAGVARGRSSYPAGTVGVANGVPARMDRCRALGNAAEPPLAALAFWELSRRVLA